MQAHVPSRPRSRTLVTLAIVLASCSILAGCFSLKTDRTYGIGAESNRMNVVVYKRATKVLYDAGPTTGRQLLLGAIPTKISITWEERAKICAISFGLCLGADEIARTIASWFKSDVRTRGDYWEAMSDAGSSDRCFAWTFVPSRNLTHKGTGTAGCRNGYLS